MNFRLFGFSLFIFSFGLTFPGLSQLCNLTGTIEDKESKNPLIGAYVNVVNEKNPKETYTVVTNQVGAFNFSNLRMHVVYKLKATFLGYSDHVMPVECKSLSVNLGTLYLTVKSQTLSEVIVKADPPAAVQKGDTTEMNAGAFITNPDASADDLIKKMPGITVENGTIKAQGEEVKKVLVDGKDFFGEDPSTALNNLPADIIDKVQIFDKLSEQAQFTGFDDGQSAKTINIITKQNKRNGKFGKSYAGTDFKEKYLAGGNLNLFNDQRRISMLGLINNVNQQNFTAQDLQGISGTSTSGKHDGGFIVGQQNGINTTRSAGINFSDNWGQKMIVTGSYFINSTQNSTIQFQKKDKFLAPKSDHFSNENDTSTARKYNHRIHMRLEYDIDSSNTIIMTPKLNFQDNSSYKLMSKITTKDTGKFVNAAKTSTNANQTGYSLDNEIVYRHKLSKPKRTFSIAVTTSANNKDPHSTQEGYLKKTLLDSISTDQHSEGNTNSYKLTSNIIYTEPISNLSLLHFNYTTAYTHSKKEREVYNIDNNANILGHVDSLSNIFTCNYFSNHAGMDYRIKSENIKFSIGAEYQFANLTGNEIYPQLFNVNKVFTNFLPNMQFNIKYGPKTSLKILYKTSTNAPNISQLQNVIDNSDRTNLNTGNPYLMQEYDHNLSCNYSFANPENSINYSFFMSAEYARNYIGSQTITAAKDTFLKDVKVTLIKNMQLTRPVNIDHETTVKSMFNYSIPIKWIQCKLNLFTGYNYSQIPGYINQNLNRYNLYSTTNGVVLSSDISEDVDFSVSYTVNYSIVKNSILMSLRDINPKYLYQATGAKITWIIWKGIVWRSDVIHQYDKGFQNFNQDYVLWNMELGKKLFNQNAEIKFSIYDLLYKNINISHTVTPQYIQDTRTNVLRRYVMISFVYNLKDFNGQEGSKKAKKDKGHKKEDF